MKKVIFYSIFTFIIALFSLCNPPFTFAEEKPQHAFYKAKVLKVVKEGKIITGNIENRFQDIQIQLEEGPDKGKTFQIQIGGSTNITKDQEVSENQTIIVMKNGSEYSLYDKFRLTRLLPLFIIFLIFIFIMAGLKGLGSIMGLLISLTVILTYIVPQILQGHDPLLISITGSLVILIITTYLAHGISKQTTVALISTFICLLLTAGLSSFLVDMTFLSGLGDEESASLLFGQTSNINLKGLMLGGVIIGTLGALNDVTTSQASAVFEFFHLNPSLSIKELFQKGYKVGKEHLVSMVNTIVLAYAGSSLTIFIFIVLNPLDIPYWVILNTEQISGEIVRTLAGSAGILLVIPIVTLLSALAAKHWQKQPTVKPGQPLKKD